MQTEKKKETKKEKDKEIVVLDTGILDDGPDWVCCWVNFIPLRG